MYSEMSPVLSKTNKLCWSLMTATRRIKLWAENCTFWRKICTFWFAKKKSHREKREKYEVYSSTWSWFSCLSKLWGNEKNQRMNCCWKKSIKIRCRLPWSWPSWSKCYRLLGIKESYWLLEVYGLWQETEKPPKIQLFWHQISDSSFRSRYGQKSQKILLFWTPADLQ